MSLLELGVPTGRSSLLLYHNSSTLKAANTVKNRLLPLRCAMSRNCCTSFTDNFTCNNDMRKTMLVYQDELKIAVHSVCFACISE